MTQQLPADVARCHGFCCQQREQCARYQDRMHYKAITPFVSHLCDVEEEGMTYYIPVKEQK